MLQTCKATIQTNKTRRATLYGSEHVVVPVVMIVDGVLNGALVTHEGYGPADAWNGRPVVVGHPQVNGEFVGASSPDILENLAMGQVFNTQIDGERLTAEIWVNVPQCERAGHKALLAALEAGTVLEVSTGYFSRRQEQAGEFNGVPYTHIDANICPDHLALLPDEVGACSVQDGCGTRPTVLQRLAQAFGLRTHHQEERTMCTKKDTVDKLVGNAKLSAEQIELLTGMDPEQLAMMQAIASGMASAAAPVTEADEEKAPPVEAEPVDMQAVTNAVRESLRKDAVVDRIVANSANALDRSTLQAMSLDQLGKYEQSIRQTDYSGAGGTNVVTHSSEMVTPINSGGLVARIRGAK